MPDMSDAAEAPAKPRGNLRGAILWTAGILVALGLAWFVGAVVVPQYRVHSVLRRVVLQKETVVSGVTRGETDPELSIAWRAAPGSERFGARDSDIREGICTRLGGMETATAKLRSYLTLPEWLATKRCEAIYALSCCGHESVPALIRELSSASPDVRCAAAWALGQVGPEAAEAAGPLERLLGDGDYGVRLAAERALEAIRSPGP
jgi:hypothetical protein